MRFKRLTNCLLFSNAPVSCCQSWAFNMVIAFLWEKYQMTHGEQTQV